MTFKGNLRWSCTAECIMTFWPRFSISRKDSGNRLELTDIQEIGPTQHFEVVLAVIVRLAGDPIFEKFCLDA